MNLLLVAQGGGGNISFLVMMVAIFVIMQVDSPQKLYNQPNNLFVAGFIGSPQMNFVDAQCGDQSRCDKTPVLSTVPVVRRKRSTTASATVRVYNCQPSQDRVFLLSSIAVRSLSLTSACVFPSTFFVIAFPFASYPAVYRPSQRPSLRLRIFPSPFARRFGIVFTSFVFG